MRVGTRTERQSGASRHDDHELEKRADRRSGSQKDENSLVAFRARAFWHLAQRAKCRPERRALGFVDRIVVQFVTESLSRPPASCYSSLVDELDREVRAFLDVALARQFKRSVAEGVPESMRAGEVDEDGWVAWEPVPSEVTHEALQELEEEVGVRLAPFHRALLLDRHFAELHCGVLYFEPHRAGTWRADLLRYLRMAGVPDEPRLVPIGFDALADAGTIYVDLRRSDDGDGPILCHDLQWLGTQHEWRTLFSSGRKMIRALTVVLERPREHWPWARATSSDADDGVARAECLEAFFAADPAGAGGPGRPWFEPAWFARSGTDA